MKTFRDLYVHLNGYDIDLLVDLFAQQSGNLWQRSNQEEERLESLGEKVFCFDRAEGGGLREVGLTLYEEGQGVWYVPNIVPLDSHDLSTDEYNELLVDFAESVVSPAIKGLPVTMELTKDTVFLKDLAGTEAAELLRRFSALANKSTGSAHPLDKKMWFSFLCAVNRQETKLTSEVLLHTLIEQGWAEEFADKLVVEFQFSQDLLTFFKGE